MNTRGHSLKYFFIVLISTSVLFAGEWPQWRGPDRNGHWQEDGIVQDFNGAPIPVLWRIQTVEIKL